jgi:hypothetical protein
MEADCADAPARHRAAAMSATAALILLIEAGTACGAVAPTQPRVGAEVVEAILDVEAQPFEPSAPVLAAVPIDADDATDQPDADLVVEQCKLAPIVIV